MPAATDEIDTRTLTQVTIAQTATTTNTYLTAQVYELVGFTAQQVPTVSDWGLLALAALLISAALCLIRLRGFAE